MRQMKWPNLPASSTAPSTANSAAAERTDAARPSAPRTAAPVPRPTSRATSHAAEDHDDDEEQDDRPERKLTSHGRLAFLRRRDTGQRDVSPLRDPRDDSIRAGEQPSAIL